MIARLIRAFAAIVLLSVCACQHIPPEPLSLDAVRTGLTERPLDVEPIRAYAASLMANGESGQAEFDLSDGLSLREGQAIALWYNADVRLARLEIERAEAVQKASGRWPDPSFSLGLGEKEVETVMGGVRTVDNSWVTSAGLSITIPISGRVGVERELRGTEYDVAVLAALEAEWAAAKEVEEAWLRWSAAQEELLILDDYLVHLDEAVTVTAALADAGELSPIDARLFRIESARRSAERARTASTERARRSEVLQAMGLTPDAPVTLVQSLAATEKEGANSIGADVAESHPTLERMRGEYEAAEQRLRLELRKQYPDLTISPSYSDEGSESTILFGFGLPIPVWNANREGIARATADRSAMRARIEKTYQMLIAGLARAQAEHDGAAAQWDRLENEAAPLLDEQLEGVRTLIEVGEMEVIVLYEVLSQYLDVKRELLNTLLARELAAARIAAATEPNRYLPTNTEVPIDETD